MKKILLILISGLVLMSSCIKEDLLETIPIDRLNTEIFWKQEDDAVLAVNALYPYLDGTGIFWFESISDFTIENRNYDTDDRKMLGGLHHSDLSTFKSTWGNAYKGIRASNFFLENVDKVLENDPKADPDLINRLKGEAMFLRAYLYNKLATLYGDVPLLTEGLTVSESKELTRTAVASVYDFISDQLEDAAGKLPESYASSDIGRITKGAAWALEARAMLYAKRYGEAATAAKKVINLGEYSLYADYENLFSYAAENNPEVILDKQYIVTDYNNGVYATLAPHSQNNTNGAVRVPTKAIVDAYEMTNGEDITGPTFDPYNPYANRDPRLGYSVFTPGDLLFDGTTYSTHPDTSTSYDRIDADNFATNTGFNVQKYVTADDIAEPGNCGLNIILIRYADVLLMAAEGLIESGGSLAEAAGYINQVRQRVNMPTLETKGVNTSDVGEMRTAVRHERSVELAFEGLRYFDIIRWKIAENVMNTPVMGMTYVEVDGTTLTTLSEGTVRSFNAQRDYLWAIPKDEQMLCPNLTQNPNY